MQNFYYQTPIHLNLWQGHCVETSQHDGAVREKALLTYGGGKLSLSLS